MKIDFSRNVLLTLNYLELNNAVKAVSKKGLQQIFQQICSLQNHNNNVEWLAFHCAGKNTISSNLILKYLDVLAYIHICNLNPGKSIKIIGCSVGQRLIIENLLFVKRNKIYKVFIDSRWMVRKFWSVAKCIWQSLTMWYVFRSERIRNSNIIADIALFTYVDGGVRDNRDPYFGNLYHYLQTNKLDVVIYISCVYTPYYKRLKEIPKKDTKIYFSLWGFLRINDYFWALKKIIYLRPENFLKKLESLDPEFRMIAPLFAENIEHELSRGYLFNLLAYRAARRIALGNKVKKLIYPFEKKAIEKCMLIGLKINSSIKTIGYQHSSISNRHFNYQLNSLEIKTTPLPDKVITLGPITTDWLIKRGRFPSDILISGCSLRHIQQRRLTKRVFFATSPRLLLVISSTVQELVSGTTFLKELLRLSPKIEVAVRTHHTLPLSMLPNRLYRWVSQSVNNLSGTDLANNFIWSDIILYISSTVALEALSCGIPLIRLNLDTLDSDPVLGYVSNRWEVEKPEECLKVIKFIAELPYEKKETLIQNASEYIKEYMPHPNATFLETFKNL